MENIEKEILQLPKQKRAILVRHLIRSLDQEEEEGNTEKLWIAEAKQRYEDFKKGKISGKKAEHVFRDARAK
ncbi:MAG: addiction module protein [Promethearchaeota archaeon]